MPINQKDILSFQVDSLPAGAAEAGDCRILSRPLLCCRAFLERKIPLEPPPILCKPIEAIPRQILDLTRDLRGTAANFVRELLKSVCL